MADTLSGIVWILYIVLGYWSVGQTIYANKIIIRKEIFLLFPENRMVLERV